MVNTEALHRRTESQRKLPLPMYPSSTNSLPSFIESSPSSPHSSSSSSLGSLVDILRPRKSRLRTTALALISLVFLSAYILLVAQPSLTSSPPPLFHPPSKAVHAHPPTTNDSKDPSADRWSALLAKYHQPSPEPEREQRQQLVLDAPHELAALTSFMAALPQNVLPPSVDPNVPLDPTAVLDFDTRSPDAPAELDGLVRDVWLRNPVVLFAKTRSPASRELKAILSGMSLRPSPTIFDVDDRADAHALVPLLHRLTGVSSLPILLVGGESVGDVAAVRALHDQGSLRPLVERAGAEPDGARRKKKGRRGAA